MGSEFTRKTKEKLVKVSFADGENYKQCSDSDVLRTILRIEEERMLWDKSDANYKNAEMKNSMWHRIEAELGFLRVSKGYNLKKMWTQLVCDYRNQKLKLTGRSGSEAIDASMLDFVFYDDMEFFGNAESNCMPEPSLASTPSVVRRFSNYENESSCSTPKRKRGRGSCEKDEEGELDKLIKMCTLKLMEPDQKSSSNGEHSDLFATISETLKTLSPADQFDLKLDIGNLCRKARMPRSSLPADTIAWNGYNNF